MSEQAPTTQPEHSTPQEQDWRNNVDPVVLALAIDPDSVTDPAIKQRALAEARRVSGGENVILTDENGKPRWGEELNRPGQALAFDSNIRGMFDQAPEDPAELNAQGFDRFPPDTLRGSVAHLIIETEDGQQLMIRRTNETNSAESQEFDITSTAKAGTEDERHPLDSHMLKNVVAIVGEPLVLGVDPDTGKHLKTRGAITKITTLNMQEAPIDPSHPHLSRPERGRGTVGEFGEAMRDARKRNLGSEAARRVVIDPGETALPLHEEAVEAQQPTNPYERFTHEQLVTVRDNIVDSVIQGVRKYDATEVARASANLSAIQREFEVRSPELRPAHRRGEVEGAITYITEPDPTVIRTIVRELQGIDGASDIARAMYGGLETPRQDETDQEARLQALEMLSLLSGVSKEIRRVTGSEFSTAVNPYASRTNEELAATVEQMRQTIQSLAAQRLGAEEFRDRLKLVGQVIKSRQ